MTGQNQPAGPRRSDITPKRDVIQIRIITYSLTMKRLLWLVLPFIAPLFGAAQTPSMATNPVSAVRAVLPHGWTILKVEDNTYPFYRPKGNGKAVFLGVSGKKYLKEQFSAVLYIMPSDYQDGGHDPTQGKAASWPARLIATTKAAKLYLWPGSQAEDWKTMQEDLLKALCEKQRTPIKAVQRTRASRFAQRQIEHHRRLAPLAGLVVRQLHAR